MKFKQPKIILLGLFSLLLIYSCGGSCYTEEFNKIKEKYSCENIDDCLNKYEFEGARSYFSLMSETEKNTSCNEFDYFDKKNSEDKIIQTELSYYVSKGEFEKAEQTANEVGYPWINKLAEIIGNEKKEKIMSFEKNLKDYYKSKDFESLEEYINLIIPVAGNNHGRCGPDYFEGYNLNSGAGYNENSSYRDAKNCFNEKLKSVLLKMKLEGFKQKQIDYFIDLYMPNIVEKGPKTSKLDYSEKNRLKQQLK